MNTSSFSDIGSADESGFGKCGDNVYWKTELFEFPQHTYQLPCKVGGKGILLRKNCPASPRKGVDV